jgi:hypothetical protein
MTAERCTRRVFRDQRSAELAFARVKQVDPSAAAKLGIFYCPRCIAFHIQARKPPPRE